MSYEEGAVGEVRDEGETGDFDMVAGGNGGVVDEVDKSGGVEASVPPNVRNLGLVPGRGGRVVSGDVGTRSAASEKHGDSSDEGMYPEDEWAKHGKLAAIVVVVMKGERWVDSGSPMSQGSPHSTF